ncbi:hypothetical protein BGS1_17170 [Clostridium beijerinckii]|nr:hypothetical protein BGS1_17170 [Clostridium beijerinckii]
MINYIGIFMCCVLLVLGILTEKKILNPITIFYGLWAVILELSSLQLFDLKETSDRTYYFILIGLIAYGIGYYLLLICTRKHLFRSKYASYLNKRKVDRDYVLRYRLLYFLGGISLLFYLRDLSIVFSYILNGSSLAYIRQLAQDSSSILYADRSAIENSIRVVFITPFVMALQPITAVDFWIGKRDRKLLVINIFIIVLRIITDGSRIVLVYLLLHLLVASIFTDRTDIKQIITSGKNRKRRNKKLFIVLILIVGGVAIYRTTLSRSGVNFLRYAYYYFSMEPYMFETWCEIAGNSGLVGYGFASTNGFWFTIFYLIKNLLSLSSYPQYWYDIYSLIQATDSQWQIIAGNATTANAYVSVFWFLYLDGRIAGIVIGMFVYGMISARVFILALKQSSSKNVCVYSMILQGICFSFVRLQFADVYYAIAFTFILLFIYKPINKK